MCPVVLNVVWENVGQQEDEVCGCVQYVLVDTYSFSCVRIYMYVNNRRFVASAALARPNLGLSERITLLPATSPMQSGFRNDFPTPPAHSDLIYLSFSPN